MGVGPHPPIPNPQSPIPNPQHSIEFNNLFILKYIFKNKKYGISGKNLEASFINMA
jgi:hypothetical protein